MGDLHFQVAQGMCVGGSTVVNNAVCFDLPDHVRDRWLDEKGLNAGLDPIRLGAAFAHVRSFLKVDEVKPMADQAGFFGTDIKNYTTLVSIEQGPSGLRPGMNAQVEILVKELENFKIKPPSLREDDLAAWREGPQDDLVLAVALAAWLGETALPPL